jgi:hypothetical protein
MSVDPAAAAAANSNAAVEAIITAELNALAADAQALQQQVAVGDVVQATVLPSNGLTDLINILGNRVAAALPPTLVPGDQITVQVTGFNGTQILLQLLSSSDGAPTTTPATAAPIPLPVSDPPTSTATTPASPTTYTPTSLTSPASAPGTATVLPNAPVPPPILPGQTVGEPAENATLGTIPGAPGTTVPTQVFGGIEARLAASRAASVQVLAPAPQAAIAGGGRAPATVALRPAPAPAAFVPPPSTPPTAGGPPRGIATPPPIMTARFANLATPPPPAPAGQSAATATQQPTAGQAAARPTAAYQDPLALVRALKLPVTPTNLAAARLALDAPQRLPAALATLESALPQSDDPRVTTLRTLTAFVGKIEPSSPQLATQIASYVAHVVSGSEPQLAQLLRAYAAEAAVPATTPDAAAGVAASAEAAAAPEAAPVAGEAPLPVVALAQIAERAATIAVSLKEQIFSLVNGPALTGHGTEVLAPAAASALSAVTSVQLAAAQAAAMNPQTMSFAIPMWLGPGGYAQAQLTVDRDAPDTPNVPMDGDNFHIAFILDTKHLGTVAIDLRMVGREYSLSVKTENLRTAQRFGDELSRLTDRLTTLRYQPKSVEAAVTLGGTAPDAAPAPPIPAIVTDPVAPASASPREFNEHA